MLKYQGQSMLRPDYFKNQTVKIFGAGDIGREVGYVLATLGGAVQFYDNNLANLAEAKERLAEDTLTASYSSLDIRDDAALQQVFESGRTDAVLVTAAITGKTNTPVEDISLENFSNVMDINVLGTLKVLQPAFRHMKSNGYGRIAVITSIAGVEGNGGMLAYSTSKAAVMGMVKSSAWDFAGPESNIRINAIAPVTIPTRMVMGNALPEATVAMMKGKIPDGRFLTINEIVDPTVILLARDMTWSNGFVWDASLGRRRQ